MSVDVLGLEGNSAIVASQSLGRTLELTKRDASIVISVGDAGVGSHCPREQFSGFLRPAHLSGNDPQQVQRVEVVRPDVERQSAQPLALGPFATLVRCE